MTEYEIGPEPIGEVIHHVLNNSSLAPVPDHGCPCDPQLAAVGIHDAVKCPYGANPCSEMADAYPTFDSRRIVDVDELALIRHYAFQILMLNPDGEAGRYASEICMLADNILDSK